MRRLMLALLAAAAHPAAAAERVASIGLCADQAVVALVDPGRIAGLSPQGRDAGLSAVADQARHLPVVAPSAEAVLMSGADLVAANEFGETKTVDMLRRLGVEVIRIPSADSFEAVTAALLNAGTKLGAQARARALADDIAARLRRLRHSRPERTAVAAYYRPDGGSAGTGTFVAAAMAAAGLDSLASRLGRHGWSRLDLETLALNEPDVFVTSFFATGAYSARQSFGRHPLARRIMARHPAIEVPARLWSCGGWPLVEAAEFLARARVEKDIR